MKYENPEMIGTCEFSKVKPYRNSPGNFQFAADAAYYYAKKHDCEMAAVPGNSWGHSVYCVVNLDEDLGKYVPAIKKEQYIIGAIVKPNGDTFRVKLRR